MTWLAESPWLIVMAGVAVEIVLTVLLLTSGRGKLLWAMAGVLLATVLLLVGERWIVTDSEQVHATLEGAREAGVSNDTDRVLSYISPDAKGLRAYAKSMLRDVQLDEAVIGGDLTIEVDPKAEPRKAIARFTLRVRGRDRRASLPYENGLAALSVGLRKEPDGKWLITDFKQEDSSRIGRSDMPVKGK